MSRKLSGPHRSSASIMANVTVLGCSRTLGGTERSIAAPYLPNINAPLWLEDGAEAPCRRYARALNFTRARRAVLIGVGLSVTALMWGDGGSLTAPDIGRHYMGVREIDGGNCIISWLIANL